MTGGIGSRLWPLSNPSYPKQFSQRFDNLSMLQKTLLRNKVFGKPIVFSNIEYKDIVLKQANEINIDIDLVLEPCMKNTTPCAIIASSIAQEQGFKYILLLPVDHHIEDKNKSDNNIDSKYIEEIKKAIKYASDSVVALGIKPSFANVSYGYIEVEELIDQQIYKAIKFIEKPNIHEANNIFQNPKYFWNLGIFIYDVAFMLKQATLIQSRICQLSLESYRQAEKIKNIIKLSYKPYEQMTSISLDFAIMEHLSNLFLVEVDFVWYDLGNWNSLWTLSEKDEQNNHFVGDVTASSVTNSYVISENKPTALLGLDNIVVVNTDNIIFIADKSRIEEVRNFAYHYSNLDLTNRYLIDNRKSKFINDWGYYEVIDNGPSYKIEKLVMSIRAKLSIHSEFNIDECWIIIQGELKFSTLNEIRQLSVNDSILIPHNQICNLVNIGETELHLIKIQINS